MDLALHSTENTQNTDMNGNDNFHHTLLNKIDEIKNKITDKEYKDLLDILHKNKINSETDENSKVVIELELMYVYHHFYTPCEFCKDCKCFEEEKVDIYSEMCKKIIKENVTLNKFKELSMCKEKRWYISNQFYVEGDDRHCWDELDNCVEHFDTVYDQEKYDNCRKFGVDFALLPEIQILSCKIVDVV